MILSLGAESLPVIIELPHEVRCIQLAMTCDQSTLEVLHHGRLVSLPLASHGVHGLVEIGHSSLVVVLPCFERAALGHGRHRGSLFKARLVSCRITGLIIPPILIKLLLV